VRGPAEDGRHGAGPWVALALVLVALLVPEAAFAEKGCPNEALRKELGALALPECRAYELVSPPYKEGWEAVPRLVSVDGSRVIGDSFGVFAAAENDQGQVSGDVIGGDAYLFTRNEATGWTTTSLNPPASRFPGPNYEGEAIARFVAASDDLGRTLWRMQPSGGETGLYLEPAPGVFEPVGRGFAEGEGRREVLLGLHSFVGASGDLSHVLFTTSMAQPLSRSGSLYEYVTSGAHASTTPVAVAVDAGGVPLGECGAVLGGATSAKPYKYVSKYNAVAENGARVFFTVLHEAEVEVNGIPTQCEAIQPSVNEVYARVETASGSSTTVAISEPTTGATGDCEACKEEGQLKSAEFQGASADGARVFFTTAQELLPGSQGSSLYEYDFLGEAHNKVRLLAPEVLGVTRVSRDGSHVYFVSSAALSSSSNGQPSGFFPEAQAGADNLYVYDTTTGVTSFVVMLCASGNLSGTVADVNCHGSDAQLWRFKDERAAQASVCPPEWTTCEDGRFLVFESNGDLTEDDESTVEQLFRYDAQSHTLVRVSIGQGGPNNDGNLGDAALAPHIPAPNYEASDEPTQEASVLSVTGDGAVTFESADGLAPGASVGVNNVYEYRDGNPYLISAARAEATSESGANTQLAAVDATGRDVFFSSLDRLVGQDVDNQRDVYDARVDGGFPPPIPVAGCGTACQGPPGSAPSFPAALSAAIPGGENLQPVAPSARPKPLTRRQRLARALKECRVRHHRRKPRARCKARARRRYGARATRAGIGGRAKRRVAR
jgi:hypothetical protein